MPTSFKPNEIVVLLGAGASYEAGIPVSAGMIDRVEKLLATQWSEFQDLYNCIKSSILYSRGIKGTFDSSHYNIESLVYTLDELVRGDEHALYPFIGSWSPKLFQVTKGDFEKIREFRNLIVRQLRDEWVQLRYESDAEYYFNLCRFKKQYNYPLRVFTLNYDLCVEKTCTDASIQRGFGDNRLWEWRLFDEVEGNPCDIYLYKLHGSIDWTRRDDERLTYVDGVTHIDPDRLAIIFGVTYKLQYVDPFLFFAYEFRRWTLDESKIIVAIGYGFGDDHINGILRQALIANPSRRLLAVNPKKTDGLTEPQIAKQTQEQVEWIRGRLGLKAKDSDSPKENEQVVWCNCKAKEFFEKRLTIEELAKHVPAEAEPFAELPAAGESASAPAMEGGEPPSLDGEVKQEVERPASARARRRRPSSSPPSQTLPKRKRPP
jgi:hypothetical protein